MFHIKLIAVGSLKEKFLREAVAEYSKRIGAYARLDVVELKECRLAENPTTGEIETALAREADAILAAVPPRAVLCALCIEGTELSSEELASKLETVQNTAGEVCLVIGSSHGLAPRVKQTATWRLSLSRLTFPHQLARVLLLETLYRSLSILNGGKYHK